MVQVVQVVRVVKVVRVVSFDDMHSENILFIWSKPSNYREKSRCHACDGQTNKRREVENSAVFWYTNYVIYSVIFLVCLD